jgi:START domain
MKGLALAAWAPLVFCLLAIEPALATGDASWQFIDDEDGIHTWRKELGDQRAAFRGQTFIRGSIDEALAPILDWKHHTEWMYGVKESTLLEQLSPTRVLVYIRVKGIWPVWDRDAISESELLWAPDHKSLVIHGHSVQSDRKRVPDRVVRMPLLKGTMKMWQVEPKRVKVLYDIEADLGGRIPQWIAKMAAKEIPYHTLYNLRKRVQGER